MTEHAALQQQQIRDHDHHDALRRDDGRGTASIS